MVNPATLRVIASEIRRHGGQTLVLPDETVTPVTTVPGALADTLSNTAAIPQPLGESEMFTTDRTDYIVFAALMFALIGALVH